MSTKPSKLTRHIPESVKLQVRQECGFGCVICGCAIIEYEHFGPEHKDANDHKAEGIALLCPTCHSKKTRGFINNERVSEARQSPKPIQDGKSHLALDVFDGPMRVRIGETVFEDVANLIEVDGESFLSIKKPTGEGLPPLITARFLDRDGKDVAKIVDNEWVGDSSAFDIRFRAQKVQVRSDRRQIDLELFVEDPSTLVVTRLDMKVGEKRIKGRAGKRFSVISPNGTIEKAFTDRVVKDVDVAIRLDNDGAEIGTDEVLHTDFDGNGLVATPSRFRAEGAKATFLRKGDPDYVEPPKVTSNTPEHLKKMFGDMQNSPVIKISEGSGKGTHGVSFSFSIPQKDSDD